MNTEDKKTATELLRLVSLWIENHEDPKIPNIYEFCYGTKRIFDSENGQLTPEDAERFLGIGKQFSYFLSAWEGAMDSAKMLKNELQKAIED